MDKMTKTLFQCGLLALLLTAFATAQAGDPVKGKEKSASCAACHGVDGNAEAPIYPKIAGQHESYLLHVLREYKSGVRQNAIMVGMVAALSDEDLKDLAAYYASQKGLYDIDIRNNP
jgi:cytochrome c553